MGCRRSRATGTLKEPTNGVRGGASCAPAVTKTVEAALVDLGYRVTRNNPYAGGFTTQHYGDPVNGVHTIQIEINRALYMDEVTLQRRAAFAKLKSDLTAMAGKIAALAAQQHDELRYQRLSAE